MADGYGLDSWCGSSLQSGRTVTGRLLLAQAAFRRITTPRGTLRGGTEELTYGIDVREYCGALAVDEALAALPSIVRAELRKDDRFAAVSVEATRAAVSGTPNDEALTLAITIQPADETASFTLTLAVSDASATILGVK